MISGEERALRLRLLQQGLSYREIGERCGVTGQAIHSWARRAGFKKPDSHCAPRSRPVGQEISRRAYYLGQVEGLPWREVGKRLERSPQAAAIAAHRYHLKYDLPWRYRSPLQGLPPLTRAQLARLPQRLLRLRGAPAGEED